MASEMSSSALSVYPHLPPTSNMLNSHQRTRLVRSTRKLGAVLGTTPCLLEDDTSFTMLPLGKTTSKLLKRQGSIFTLHQISSLSIATTSTTSSHYPSSSVSSIAFSETAPLCNQSTETLPLSPPGLSTIRRQRLGDKAPQLFLRLDAAPLLPSDEHAPCTPLTPTPITPTIPDVAEVRRKRMAKLARHLGEVIPVELVAPAESDSKPVMLSPNHLSPQRRSRSVDVPRTEVPRNAGNGPFPARPRQDWSGEWNRSNMNDVRKELRKLRVK